ncbi:MAG: class II aldolase/adducin family protein [Spirochaetaceae bacterium]|nr:MAG: class II aldolase/adducin family protein [Spirochaetaceae bacterium]
MSSRNSTNPRDLSHPRDQIVEFMERIYGYGMTTTSGGNLSIRDDNGDVWVSPAGHDKGSLAPHDIVCVHADGSTAGPHRPSSELPFHLAIYAARPDVRAVVHAHPPALVAFSLAGTVPDTRIIPKARLVCGDVGFAPYELPGSDALGRSIAAVFARGHDTVVLENHGIVCSGVSLFEAFGRFETLDFCARLSIEAHRVGSPHTLTEEQLGFSKGDSHLVDEFDPGPAPSRERELRTTMVKLIRRAYDQMLFTSTEGTFSCRLADSDLLITPYGVDRKRIDADDIVLVAAGRRERGKTPSRSLSLHQKIYARHLDVNAILIAHPPSVMAYGVAHEPFNTRTIPESYVMLRDIALLEYGAQYTDQDSVAAMIGPGRPFVIVENDCAIVVGSTLLEAFDRLEVAEFSARSVIAASAIGPITPIAETQVEALRKAFGIR